jgi:hypothetical protein
VKDEKQDERKLCIVATVSIKKPSLSALRAGVPKTHDFSQ